MSSIRTRLLWSLGCCTTLILLVSFSAVYAYVAQSLTRTFDEDLARKLRAFALMSEVEGDDDDEEHDGEIYEDRGDDLENQIHFEFAELAMPEYAPGPDAEYYQVWDSAGRILTRSPSLQGDTLTLVHVPGTFVSYQDGVLPDGRDGRLAVMAFQPIRDHEEDDGPPPSAPLVLAVARSTGELNGTLGVLLGGLSMSALMTMGIMLLLVWFLVKRNLAPIDAVCHELTQVDAEELAHHFEVAHRPEELQPICQRLNELLARLRESFERERRFNADVAHELRTPIAELRALAEVSRNREGIGAVERKSFEDALDIATGMERLTTSLLDIARCHGGQMGVERAPVVLQEAIADAWSPFATEAHQKGLGVVMELGETCVIQTDPVLFGLILTNLFSNAVAYSPEGGQLRLSVVTTGGHVNVTLNNEAPDLTAEDVARMYDTFWRRDEHTADPRHAGVGLSLVRALTGVLECQVVSEVPSKGTCRVTLKHAV